jgi:signal transduction histidine kinase
MNYYEFSFLVGSLASFFLGLFVYLKDRKNIINITWCLSSLAAAVWSFGFFCMLNSSNKEEASFWRWFMENGSTLIPAFWLHFAYSLLSLDKKKNIEIIICYFMGVIIWVFNCTPLFAKEIVPKYIFDFYPTAGIGYYVFFFYFLTVVARAFYQLIKNYKKRGVLKANQIKCIILGGALAFIGGGTTFFLTFNIPILPYTIILFAIYPFVVAYAIVKYQVMDIAIVIRKTAIYSIVATFITVSYFVLIYIMESMFRGFIGYKSVPWTLSVIVIFTLIFQPLKNMVQIFVDRHFFKGSQVLLQEELKKAQDELKRTERLKAVGTLAAGMAHEIKNPLTGIKTFAEYLPSKHNDPEFLEKFQKIVTTEVTKINDIVQQLLDFSKPKPLKLEQANIHTLLDQTLSFLNNDFVKYRINVIKNYDSALPLLNLDPNQMKQVFLNLFLNAIDAMKQSGVLTVTTKLIQDNAEITIQDTGTGISKKDLEHVFDPFYSTKDTGTGLGMSIVYGIIKEHNGEIGVSSEVGKGAVFRIRLQR